MYLRNAWYVAGFSDEIDGRWSLARRMLDQLVVLSRAPDGGVAAGGQPAVERHGLLWWWPGEAPERQRTGGGGE